MKILKNVIEEIEIHARHDAPVEACGYLARKDDAVTKAFPLTNADKSEEHFSFVPAEQFAVVKAMRAEGLTLAGVYHSHPASPARPSEEDIRLLCDGSLTYVIVSLKADAERVRAFRIEKGAVTPQEIMIADEQGYLGGKTSGG